MQKLWGSLRAMQMIVYPNLIQVTYPPHTQLFMKVGVKVSNMDVMGGLTEDMVHSHFEFKKTEALNQQFENYGFESQNFILLSGSYLLFKYGIFIFKLLKYALNRGAVSCRKNEKARKLGVLVYEDNYWKNIKKY